MSTNVCRQGCWCRSGGGERAHIAGFFKPKSTTDDAKESPVLMHSSSGGGASGDADVVVTGVVSKGEGGAGAGSFADVDLMGVVNGLEYCEGAGVDMGGVFSDAADASCPRFHLLRGIASGCQGACFPTLPINSLWYWQSGGVVGGSDKLESRVSPRGVNCLPRHLQPRLCGNGRTTRRHVRAVLRHQGHGGLQGFVHKRGACPPLINSDYIDHLALTQGFTYSNNLKYSLASLALAMSACLPRLFVNARVSSKPPTDAQPRNEPPSEETKKEKKLEYRFFGASGGRGG